MNTRDLYEKIVDETLKSILEQQKIIISQDYLKSKIQQQTLAAAKDQKDNKALDENIREFVSLLRTKLLAKLEELEEAEGLKAQSPISQTVYANLISLAQLYPLNNDCCFSNKTPSKNETFFLASGYVCHPKEFRNYFYNSDDNDKPNIRIYNADRKNLIAQHHNHRVKPGEYNFPVGIYDAICSRGFVASCSNWRTFIY